MASGRDELRLGTTQPTSTSYRNQVNRVPGGPAPTGPIPGSGPPLSPTSSTSPARTPMTATCRVHGQVRPVTTGTSGYRVLGGESRLQWAANRGQQLLDEVGTKVHDAERWLRQDRLKPINKQISVAQRKAIQDKILEIRRFMSGRLQPLATSAAQACAKWGIKTGGKAALTAASNVAAPVVGAVSTVSSVIEGVTLGAEIVGEASVVVPMAARLLAELAALLVIGAQ